jgi:cardiolipin synthase A/B
MPTLLDRIVPRPRDKHHEAHRHARAYKILAVLSLIALILQSSMLLLSLFEQPLPYAVTNPGPEPVDSPEFVRLLAAITGGGTYTHNRVDVLANGEAFYDAELRAIRAARRFVFIECYIIHRGHVADQLMQALEERARAGVKVRMVIDAVGSAAFPDSRFDALRAASGRVAWYHLLRWYSWPRANNRTHRELVVADGKIGFIGGAGFADQWLSGSRRDPRWRDTMVRVEGEAATGLAVTFAENWLESAGEMLLGPEYFPFSGSDGRTNALVVTSSPTSGRSTEARVLVQSLIAKAAKSIHITNPYFMPDKSLRRELVKAVLERKVDVTILVPGKRNDHLLSRRSSRLLYGDLLRAGARIFEYRPAMIHAKTMVVDGFWAVAGSTNLDSRSFGLNDEVNIAMPDPSVARRLEQDFEDDLRVSRRVNYDEWKRRPPWEKLEELMGWLLMNQE